MTLTPSQLDTPEELGELQFSLEECAIVLQVDIQEFCRSIELDDILKMTYERGRLKASAAVRKAILQQAKQGSSPAQKQMMELIQPKQPNTQKIKPKKPHQI